MRGRESILNARSSTSIIISGTGTRLICRTTFWQIYNIRGTVFAECTFMYRADGDPRSRVWARSNTLNGRCHINRKTRRWIYERLQLAAQAAFRTHISSYQPLNASARAMR